MRKKIFIFAVLAIAVAVLFDSCRTRHIVVPRMTLKKMISVPKEPTSNFSKTDLQRFIVDNPGASVVAREPKISTNANIDMNTVCALIERGLMQKGYNPRDRRLFENSIDKMVDGSNYVEIRKQTGVDLIFEITQFNVDEYDVNKYYMQNTPDRQLPFMSKPPRAKKGQPQEPSRPLSYRLTGFSIEIKVILLQDNLVAGVFKYYKQPCTEGCEVNFQNDNTLRYIDNSGKTTDLEEGSIRRQSSNEMYSREVSDFVTNTVIPNMFAEMEGKKIINDNTNSSGYEETLMTLAAQDGDITEMVKVLEKAKKEGDSFLAERSIAAIDLLSVSARGNDADQLYLDGLSKMKLNIQKAQNISDGTEQTTYKNMANNKTQPRDKQKQLEERKQASEQNRRRQEERKQAEEEQAKADMEADVLIAQNSTNSFGIAASVAENINSSIKKQEPQKYSTFKSDLERFDKLKDKNEISKYILSITSPVAYITQENEGQATIYVQRLKMQEAAMLLFIDGQCAGVGTRNKGLLTQLSKDNYNGMHTLQWRYIVKDKSVELANIPVNFSIKTNYIFTWNGQNIKQQEERNEIAKSTIEDTDVSPTQNSTNSFEIAASVTDKINDAIKKQEPKKYSTFRTDLERFDKLKDISELSIYILSVTSPVAYTPQENEEQATIYVESAKIQEVTLLLFIDGQLAGVGTRNKGLLTKLSKDGYNGMHTLQWRYIVNGKSTELEDIPVNFSIKSNYMFSWMKNQLIQKN
ncbi:MAG: hypothetical protein FWD66_05180 [Paludibacter sp.]|nr:hypothetical protein [Paludibacter sp.]